jgi:hypothetical protein
MRPTSQPTPIYHGQSCQRPLRDVGSQRVLKSFSDLSLGIPGGALHRLRRLLSRLARLSIQLLCSTDGLFEPSLHLGFHVAGHRSDGFPNFPADVPCSTRNAIVAHGSLSFVGLVCDINIRPA